MKYLFKVVDGGMRYDSPNVRNEIGDYIRANDGKEGELIFNIYDSARQWQHKYYRGYILPVIAEGQGEKDIDYVHEFALKDQFLFFPVSSLAEIPKKHRERCRISESMGEITGYVPSTAVLTYDEFKEYILKCEAIRDGLIDWTMPPEAMKYRQLAFKQDPNQGNLFEGGE